MKKIFAMILCLALLLSSAAMAETAPDILSAFENTGKVNGTLETEVTLSVNEDAFTMIAAGSSGNAEQVAQIVKPIVAIINNLKFKVLTDNGNMQLDLLLKDTALASFASKKGEDGTMAIVTDLLPDYIIKADMAKAGVAGTAGVQLTEDEQKAIAEAGKARLNQYLEDIKAKLGEKETGSWVFDGVTFTERQPLNMTAKEVSVMTLKAFKDLVEDPAMKKVTDALGDKFDASKLDEAIANAEQKEDSEYPAMTWYSYTNAEGNECYEVTMEKDSEKTAMIFTVIGKKVAMHADIDAKNKGKIEGLVDAENLTVSINADVDANGTPANIAFELAAHEDGSFTGTIALSMNGMKMFALDMNAKASSEQITASFDEEGKKVVPLEALSDNSSAESKEVMNALMTTLPGLLQKAMKVMPDEVNVLITLLSGASK